MELNGTFASSAFHYVAPTLDLARDASIANRALLAVLVVFMMSIGFYSKTRQRGPDLSHIPVLFKDLSTTKQIREYRSNAKGLLRRGYEEYNKTGKPFQLQTPDGPMVILNAKQSDEVASLPDRILDKTEPRNRILEKSYTGLHQVDGVVIRIIKTQLSSRLPELGDVLADQADKCFAKEFSECKDWTPIHMYDHLLRIIAAMSTRVFGGEELAANEQWLSGTIDYTVQIFTTAMILKRIPSFLLPLVYRFIPAYWKLWKIRKMAVRLIKPIVQARREAMEAPGYAANDDDMLQWMLNERVKKQLHDKDYELLAQFQLELALAAIHTTSMAVMHVLFDLIAWPEYIEPLRREIKEQYAMNGDSFQGQFMRSLPKLDSFMKESQVQTPPSYTSTGRDVRHDITLSDGTFLPKGTFVVANTYQINHDDETPHSDAAPNVFDGLRYEKMRNKLVRAGLAGKEAEGKHQFVSLTDGSSSFGQGKHACPGRFFAANEIKLLLAKFLMHFDFKMPPGESGRYESDSYEHMVFPNTDKTIMMKRI